MAFEYSQTVLFQHCDPAGIVFYPRYFEMLNATIEAWFYQRLGHSFARVHGPMGLSVPTAAIEVRFSAPSRLGDELKFMLRPIRIGRTSLTLGIDVNRDGENRLAMTSTLVCVAKETGRPVRWPDTLRQRIEAEVAREETGDA